MAVPCSSVFVLFECSLFWFIVVDRGLFICEWFLRTQETTIGAMSTIITSIPFIVIHIYVCVGNNLQCISFKHFFIVRGTHLNRFLVKDTYKFLCCSAFEKSPRIAAKLLMWHNAIMTHWLSWNRVGVFEQIWIIRLHTCIHLPSLFWHNICFFQKLCTLEPRLVVCCKVEFSILQALLSLLNNCKCLNSKPFIVF